MGPLKTDLRDDGVGPAGSILQSRAMGDDPEHATARGDDPAIRQALGAAMDDVDPDRELGG